MHIVIWPGYVDVQTLLSNSIALGALLSFPAIDQICAIWYISLPGRVRAILSRPVSPSHLMVLSMGQVQIHS
jgi:hypothetical protein